MNLPSNHRLLTPDELANGPWRDLKYRTKHEPAEWLTWDERLGAPDAKSLESFYFAVPAAEEKGEWVLLETQLPEPNQWITAETPEGVVYGKASPTEKGVVLFDFYSGTAGAKIIRWKPRQPSFEQGHPWTGIERGEPPISRRPTPAIQQAVDALEKNWSDRLAEMKDTMTATEFEAACLLGATDMLEQCRDALRHLNGQVRG